MDLIEINGLLMLSSKYNNRSDGNAIKNKIKIGKIVQIISIIVLYEKYELINLLIINDDII